MARPRGRYILVDVKTILSQRAQGLQLIRRRPELFREVDEKSPMGPGAIRARFNKLTQQLGIPVQNGIRTGRGIMTDRLRAGV